jgi:hypothetical protein
MGAPELLARGLSSFRHAGFVPPGPDCGQVSSPRTASTEGHKSSVCAPLAWVVEAQRALSLLAHGSLWTLARL